MDVQLGVTIPVDILLGAYRKGWFPMSHPDGNLYWHDPDPRAIFPLDTLKTDRRSLRMLRSNTYEITVDKAFEQVITACGDRKETWIDERVRDSYVDLHRAGHAHSVEAWRDGALVGGVYGVAIGGAFFAESMFHRMNNAGKVALTYLFERSRELGFTLMDSQYLNDFTESLGAVEVPRTDFRKMLARALDSPVRWIS